MSLPQKLLEYRRAEKLSQEDLAAQLGVSRQSVSKWEQGLSFPETEKLIELSNRMGISIDCLLKGGDETPEAPVEAPQTEEPVREAEPVPVRKNTLTVVLAVLLAIVSLALVFTLFWRTDPDQEVSPPEEHLPSDPSATVGSTLPADTTEPETEPPTEPSTAPAEPVFENSSLMELRDWFFRFGREYRLDYMPRFTEEDGPPTDSGEYLYWAYAVKPDKEDDVGKMSVGYVNNTVQKHFHVFPLDHRSHHKQWTLDEQTQIYTAWPEGMREMPYYLLNSIEMDGDRFTVHATCYTTMGYLASEEDDRMVYDLLMEGKTEDLVRHSEITITFRLDTLIINENDRDPNIPVFVSYTVTEVE